MRPRTNIVSIYRAAPNTPRPALMLAPLILALYLIVPVEAAGRSVPARLYHAAARTVVTEPAAAWGFVHEARSAASQDRHGASIRYYLEAVALHPPLKTTVAREMGYQYMRADNPEAALFWFETYLEVCPLDVESLLGTARALNRGGRTGDALACYRIILPLCENLPLDVRLEFDKVTAGKDEL